MPRVLLLATLVSLLMNPSSLIHPQTMISTGADVLIKRSLELMEGQRVGLVTNHTGRLSSGEFLVDALRAKGVRVTALFGPEHGIRGAAGAGENVRDSVDAGSGIPVYSLYGKHNTPTEGMLRDIDVLVYDIQDVGARFYTYISTMKLCMEAAAGKGIPYMVLDRPNPLGARVDGPLLEDSLRSFVGPERLPVVYGLTIGELATMMNTKGMLKGGVHANLIVVWMEGWSRNMRWTDTGLPWIAPSPNIPTPGTADIYPATCFLEATNVSEGRGTTQPFLQLGAPFLNGDTLAARLNARMLPGVRFSPASFTPTFSKHTGETCSGAHVTITDLASFRPVVTGLTIIRVLLDSAPGKVTLNSSSLGRLLGIRRAYDFLVGGGDPGALESTWKRETDEYVAGLRPYMHYPDR
jgi:uncharacterized protein YbbC (DUF1343 family)